MSRPRRHHARWYLAAAVAAPALALAGGNAGPALAAVPAAPSGWTTVFSEDFAGAAGTGLNTANWLYDVGTGYPGGASNWGTGEIETMTSSTTNVYQDGAGHLAIKPIRDAAGNWTSGRVETRRTDLTAPAGGVLRVEGSIQQPNVNTANGAGYWPAFWMLGAAARPVGATNWPSIGEWDIMENINGRPSVFSTLHCGVGSGGPCNETTGLGSGEHACSGCNSAFHTYAVEYDRSVSPEQMRFYLDGSNYHTVTAAQVDAATWNAATQHGMFIILNVAIGGGFPAAFGGGPNAATVSGVPMLVDYVAAYTRSGTGATAGPTASPTPSPTPTATPTATPTGGARDAYATIQAESYNAQSGTAIETTSDTGGGQDVTALSNGDYLLYRNVNFGSTAARQFYARLASGAAGGVSGLVEVRLDSRTSSPVGSLAVGNTGGAQSWRTVPANIAGVTGSHDVYITFTSGQPAAFANANWFSFGH